MQFHLELTPDRLPQPLRLQDKIVSLGSCFAEVMGRRLADHKLNVLNNPFGTLFNPVSIAKLITLALNETLPDENRYVQRDGLWFHYDFHSSLWADSRDALRSVLAERLAEVADALRSADWLFLTFGSAVVHRHIDTGKVVANCHKQPATLFERYLYHTDHLRDDLTRLLKTLRRANPKLRVLLTVSPVRHSREGLVLNSASKAALRSVVHELTVWHSNVQYFPAYELMMDDLRDYRFYEADLIHPNAQAHDYIWQKFVESAADTELRGFIAEWAEIRRALAHRPLHGPTDAHRQFLQNLLKRLDHVAKRVNVAAEQTTVQQQLETYVNL